MLIPLGFLAGSGAGFESDYELISSTILGSAASDVTFASLGTYSSTYKHLQIRATARMTTGSVFGIYSQLNGDTGANYSHHLLFGNGSTVTSAASTLNTFALTGLSAASTSDSNVFSSTVIDLLDPYAAKNKTFRTLSGVVSTGIHLHSGIWVNTASLTSWKLYPQSGNWAIGSRFSLYGIKG
jgi:hypothetical protein